MSVMTRMLTVMAFDQASARKGSGKRARIGTVLLVSASIAGLLFAAVAMVITAVTVRLIAANQSQSLQVVIVAAGTTVGACVGGWVAQPRLTRFASRMVTARYGTKDD
jgi:hypothetical protein